MRFTVMTIVAIGLIALVSTSAHADDYASSRDVQAAVDSYMATGSEDASLVGGTGSAGYDAGFWIRGGDFLLRINATLQARYEAWDWDDEDLAEDNQPFGQPFAGDTSGFSLPRATLKFSGEAPCNIRYYIELEFGHFGRDVVDRDFDEPQTFPPPGSGDGDLGSDPRRQTNNFDNTREAWIEWGYCPAFNFRMGQVQLPSTRQLMTAPELQQFVDISFASACTARAMPGYTDRNRDHGFLVHGAFGCNNEWSYIVSVTNGDGGDSVRNVLDHRTSDNLAFGGRVNWAFLAPIGYEEGALRQQTCQWYGELGAYGFFYADRSDKPHTAIADVTVWGVDLAMGWGGFSLTAAISVLESSGSDLPFEEDMDVTNFLVQLGYHFPGTAWEIAARGSGVETDVGGSEGAASEFAFGVNYYLNGHANKLQLDVSWIEAQDDFDGIFDAYAGYQPGFQGENSAMLIRFQWQLAL